MRPGWPEGLGGGYRGAPQGARPSVELRTTRVTRRAGRSLRDSAQLRMFQRPRGAVRRAGADPDGPPVTETCQAPFRHPTVIRTAAPRARPAEPRGGPA